VNLANGVKASWPCCGCVQNVVCVLEFVPSADSLAPIEQAEDLGRILSEE
jgi:hypothetical protein